MKNPEEILQEYPNSIVFARVAEILADRGELDNARGILDTGIALHPGYSPGYAVRAHILASTGDREGALEALDRAIALDPQSPADILRLAQLYVEMGRHDAAESTFGTAERFEPDARQITDMLFETREKAAAVADTAAENTVDTAVDIAENTVDSTADTAAVLPVEYTVPGMDSAMSDAVAELMSVSADTFESVATVEPVASLTDEDMDPIEIVTMDMMDDSSATGPVEVDVATDVSAELTVDTSAEILAEGDTDTGMDSASPPAEPAEPVGCELPESEDIAPEQAPEGPAIMDEDVEATEVLNDFVEEPEDTLPVVEEPEDTAVDDDEASLTIAPWATEPVMEAQDTDWVAEAESLKEAIIKPVEEPVEEPAAASVEEPVDSGVAPSDAVDKEPSGEIDLSWLDEEVPEEDPPLTEDNAEYPPVAVDDGVIDLDGLDEDDSDYSALLKDTGVAGVEPKEDTVFEINEDEPADDQPTVDDDDLLCAEERAELLSYDVALSGTEPEMSAPEETESDSPAVSDDMMIAVGEGEVSDAADGMESETSGAEGLYADLSTEEIDVLSSTGSINGVRDELIMDEDEEGIDYSDILAGYGASTAKDGSDITEANSEESANEIDTAPETLPYVAADDGPISSTEPSPWEVDAEPAAEPDSDSMRAIEDLIRSAPDVPFMHEDDLPEIPSAAPEPELYAEPELSAKSDSAESTFDVPAAAPVIATPEIDPALSPAPDSASDEPSLDDLITRYEKTIDNTVPSEPSEPSEFINETSDYTITMAEIYVAQGLVSKAVEIYTALSARDSDNDLLSARLETLRSMRDERADES